LTRYVRALLVFVFLLSIVAYGGVWRNGQLPRRL